ncbi:Aste57867_20065 [Aphanomyces stellatus]|uniref:Aste57867_20065 protein n=1 Tax=Aphanomyces stellatus TaxID=120398 RepID=A0A485LE83_9STRA|nr:hypothetical protein As57867_019999 [Aphanomyces stellatus]VFT96760.1 Aste57867_20065 [Aphanomyces stellatus]
MWAALTGQVHDAIFTDPPTRCSASIRHELAAANVTTLRFEHLTVENAPAVAALLVRGFAHSPLVQASGQDTSNRPKNFLRICDEIARAEAETQRPVSIVCYCGETVVAAIHVRPPAPVASKDTVKNEWTASNRLSGCLAYTMETQNGRGRRATLDLPELSLTTVDPAFRGTLVDSQGVKQSLYQRMVAAAEHEAAKYWRGIFSISNDISAARHIQDKWTVVVRLPYSEFPPQLIVDQTIDGAVNICVHEFDRP